MGNYTNLTSKEAKEILTFYSLGELLDISPLSLGISNSNFKLTTSKNGLENDYLLKISNDKNQEELIGEQQILDYLQKIKFSFSICPLSNLKDNKIFTYKNYIGAVFPFIKGHPPTPGNKTCQEIGRALALLHSTKPPEENILRKHQQIGFEAPHIFNFQQNEKCPKEYKEYFHKIFPKNLRPFMEMTFQEGIIHGDLYYDNTLFRGDELVTLLDFEQSGIGPLILDIGISISGSCLNDNQIELSLIDSFLKGYESIRILPDNEKFHLNTSILLGLFSISLWRIFRFKFGKLDPKRTNSYLELLEKANHFYQLVK